MDDRCSTDIAFAIVNVAPMVSIEPRQEWTSFDGDDTITISHVEASRWIISTPSGDTRHMIAAEIRARYRPAHS